MRESEIKKKMSRKWSPDDAVSESRKEKEKKNKKNSPMALAYDLKTRTTRANRLASALMGPPRRAGTTRRAAGAVAER